MKEMELEQDEESKHPEDVHQPIQHVSCFVSDEVHVDSHELHLHANKVLLLSYLRLRFLQSPVVSYLCTNVLNHCLILDFNHCTHHFLLNTFCVLILLHP